jgi:hypothetical protein
VLAVRAPAIADRPPARSAVDLRAAFPGPLTGFVMTSKAIEQ